MFTGIVQTLGRVVQVQDRGQDREFEVEGTGLETPLEIGDSVAIDGVCLTATRVDPGRFRVQAVAETLRVTTLGQLEVDDPVNLETAIAVGRPLGGHFVQGHVDGLATVRGRENLGESVRMTFSAPSTLVAQLVPKGSVALDGVSLTVGPQIGADSFEVFLIPHTLQATTLGRRERGDIVNLETDILGKYVQRYLQGTSSNLTWDDLQRAGFPGAGEATS